MMEQEYRIVACAAAAKATPGLEIGRKIVNGMAIAVLPSSPASPVTAKRLRPVDLKGPAGSLEALVNEGTAEASFAGLVCHPHPMGGGTLHNKVVYHAMKVLNDPEFGFGFPVLRFNFRGTGRSEGRHDGRAEAGDVRSALDWLENEYNRPAIVVGFSFGAAMVLSACCASDGANVKALAALGLPIQAEGRIYPYQFLKDCTIPKLFLSGDQDQYAPQADLERVIAVAAAPKDSAFIPRADHFFTGRLAAMQLALAAWLKEQVL